MLASLSWINAAMIIYRAYNILPGHFKDIFESLNLFGTLIKFTGASQYLKTFCKPYRFLLSPKPNRRKVPKPGDPDWIILCSCHRIKWLLKPHFELKHTKFSCIGISSRGHSHFPGKEAHVLFLTLSSQSSKLQTSQGVVVGTKGCLFYRDNWIVFQDTIHTAWVQTKLQQSLMIWREGSELSSCHLSA